MRQIAICGISSDVGIKKPTLIRGDVHTYFSLMCKSPLSHGLFRRIDCG